MSFINKLQATGVVAVIRGKSAEHAFGMCEALLRGGVTGIELTFTTPDCTEVVKKVADTYGDKAVIGVGSVRTVEQLKESKAAGAIFAVSPHSNFDLMDAAKDLDLPYLPGTFTPTEVVNAWDRGAPAVKVFPASQVGPGFIKGVKAPLPEIQIMPTGGVSIGNMAEWFAAGAVAVGMGGQLVTGSNEQIEAAAREAIAELTRIRS